jgi:hypothetical protein
VPFDVWLIPLALTGWLAVSEKWSAAGASA